MKIKQIIQIVYEADDYDRYLKERDYLIEQGYSISDYSNVGFILCEWVIDEREVDKNGISEDRTSIERRDK